MYINKLLYTIIILAMMCSCIKEQKGEVHSYGYEVLDGSINFRIHAPSSQNVFLIIFDDHASSTGKEFLMERLKNGDWYYHLEDAGYGTIYGYRLTGPDNEPNVIVADPYSKAAITQNSWRHIAKSLVVNEDFDWGDDIWMDTKINDLIIYEAHVRDMTIHPSSKSENRGSYLGFVDSIQVGGISHLKSLGVNAVQLLPVWDFANFEIPYRDSAGGFFNDWNPYERNHWGYMPTFFMAPESYYSSSWTDSLNAWNGVQGKAVNEMKTMVKELHKNDISVILDVVVNHVSNYDFHPLKYIDKKMYFHLDENGDFKSQCCGNLLNTDHPKVRQYIIDALKYWMTSYHIDGFRFDQCMLLSAETALLIKNELRSLNPNVIIYGEAWGREEEFSELGWGSFNAHFRDVLKGQLHDRSIKGFLQGDYRPNENIQDIKSLILGSTIGKNSRYINSNHSLNYLEAHDDHTFNDYLKLSSQKSKEYSVIINEEEHLALNENELKMHKLGALLLMTSQGIPFMHQGQEWGNTKVIAKSESPDGNIGKIDRNSYNKDNETNWMDWNEVKINGKLIDYYKDLITIRKTYSEFRNTNIDNIKFQNVSERALSFLLENKICVIINGQVSKDKIFNLPAGRWRLILDHSGHHKLNTRLVKERFKVGNLSGAILIKI